jgi:EAL domain-containing protein (putative c-di-GMP-specific phosphodiesterase class I)
MSFDVEPHRARFATLTALIIDDQEHVRRWVGRVLREMGIDAVTEAGGGQEAFALIAAPGAAFDVIICDLKMPEFDGIQLVRSMALLGVESAVILSSVESERVLETSALLAEERGLRLLGVIAKPITPEKLGPLLQTLDAPVPVRRPAPPMSREALRRELPKGSLSLVYQPKIAIATGRVVGVEALARWRHPELGNRDPDTFVQLCEEEPRLGAWLLEFTLANAIGFAARRRERGEDLEVAVNIHAGAFDDLDLPERIEALAQAHGVPANRLILELTERSVAQDAVGMLDVATRLRLKGFGLAIDDFGTGHSGLAQLRRLPFNQIKIDRQFVHGSADSSSKRSVVEASVALARNLGMTSVAEGVQRRAEWELLRQLGCEQMQGYYVARAMSEEGLQAWSTQWNPSALSAASPQ